MLLLVKCKDSDFQFICDVADEDDALLAADRVWRGTDRQEKAFMTRYSEYLTELRKEYSITPISRTVFLKYVENRLKGDKTVSIEL